MPKIAYTPCNFRQSTLTLIQRCNDIIAEYTREGYKLTLRQLYYQLVSRDVIQNSIKEYTKLGNTISDARLAGLIDWNSIEDRTRNLASMQHWDTPAEIVEACAHSFHTDKWANQSWRVEVWIEKEALAGVFERICNQLDVPYFCCRGYTSQSEMWAAAMRYVQYLKQGKRVKILHFGDHDPSGIDMTRDIQDRLRLFVSHHSLHANRLTIQRIALNMDQVRQYDPPENPAKSTDSRFAGYLAEFGESSWELDALNPRVLSALVRENVAAILNSTAWDESCIAEAAMRASLKVTSDNWEELNAHIEEQWSDDVAEAKQAELKAMGLSEDEEEEDGDV